MSEQSITQATASIAGPVAEQLLKHLDDEKTSLSELLSAVRHVNVALTALDDNALRESLDAEVRELASNTAIQKRRDKLRDDLAKLLHVDPLEVTLGRLIKLTSGTLRESIESVGRSLLEMSREVDRLNRQNAAMIGQSLSIARGVIEQISGVAGVGESYNATGVRAGAHVGPLMQWGG